MKKKIAILLLTTICTFVYGCGSSSASYSSSTESTSSDSLVESESPDSAKADAEVLDDTAPSKDLPDGDYSDIGDGEMYISTPGGTSEDDAVPVLFVQGETLMQIGLDTTAFDGSKLSYIYIDGMLLSKEQLSDSQTTLTLDGNALQVGSHVVEVVQYEGDDPSDSIITYKSASYEVKSK